MYRYASEAGKKERQLSRMREQNGFQDQQNIDLTYAIIFNLAHQYHKNGQMQVGAGYKLGIQL
jgi:intraflagellar transport protein 88